MKTILTILALLGSANAAFADGSGNFDSVAPHQVMGAVKIEPAGPYGTTLILGTDFKTTAGPELQIVLRDSKGMQPMVAVASLEKTEGEQTYAVDLTPEQTSLFDEVVIYCAKYHVDFGLAKIK